MKLCTFTALGGDGPRAGVVEGDAVIDFTARAPDLPRDLKSLIALWDCSYRSLEAALATAPRLPLESVRLLAPIPRPGKFLAVGLNYLAHIEELGLKPNPFPSVFTKQVTCINAPGGEILNPIGSDMLDYEVELGFVICRRCRRVGRDDAPGYIAGYVVVNDVSIRDWQRRTQNVTLGKSFDSHGPFGPWMTTPDEVGDPQMLMARTWVNGELRQESSTSDMLFGCYELIEKISSAVTLEPGDVITTGTPPGVAAGMKPPRYLRTGDVVRVEIEGLGALEHRVVDERRS